MVHGYYSSLPYLECRVFSEKNALVLFEMMGTILLSLNVVGGRPNSFSFWAN